MPLQIRPPVQVSALDLAASPYIGSNLWEEGAELFHNWMFDYFSPKDVFPDFQLAIALDVHRIIADEWLCALHFSGRIIDVTDWKGDIYVSSFRVKAPSKRIKSVKIKVGDLRNYDPWVDRMYDADLPNARFPDYFIDKYYDVFINEHFLAYGKMRKRPNGKTFQPLDMSEHPRHAENSPKTQRHLFGEPPPDSWRDLIDTTACV